MKKIVSLFLSAALVVCAFAGCSKEEKKKEKETTVENSITYTVDAHNSSVNQSVVRAYEQLCDAVVSGKEEALFNTSLIADVNKLFYSDFPLSYLVNKLEINDNNSGVKITYEKDMENHIKAVEEFKNRLNEILTACGYGKVSKNILLLNIYSYLTKNITLSSQFNYSYDAIVGLKGYSFSITSAFTYLLNQAGINASIINAMNEDGICFMTEAEFDGCRYVFIPFLEADENAGSGLCYFALDYSELVSAGFTDVSYSDGSGVAFDDTDKVYTEFRDSVAYILDGNHLSVTKNNGENVQLSI